MLIQMVTEDNKNQKTAMLMLSGNKSSGSPTQNDSYNLDYNQYESDPSTTILNCLNVAIPKLIKEMG